MGAHTTHEPPLCVDLDGTLLRGDIGVESALTLLRRRPLLAFALPFWLLGGLAQAKRRVAERISIDPATLPYDDRVLELLRGQPEGRVRVLASASDALLVQQVADHLCLFDVVIASDGVSNLSGGAKAAVLVERYGERGFDYAGNASADLAVWARARRAIVVNATSALAKAAVKRAEVEHVFPRQGNVWHAWWRAIRPHQWLKNFLLFVPLLAAHRWSEAGLLAAAVLAWFAFSLCASGTYLVNDLLDLEADRHHPRKRRRPFARGALPLWQGMLAAVVLAVAAFGLALWQLPSLFAWTLAAYLVLTLGYSFGFKRIAMFDVIVLAALYTLRLFAGGAATSIPVSFWLLFFSMFLFLGLAMLKRYAELRDLQERQQDSIAGRGYSVGDLPLVLAFGAGSGLLSVLVLALYIDSTASEALYQHPIRMGLLCPLLLYWTARAWHIAQRGEMHDDPVVFAARDQVSWLLLLFVFAISWIAL